MIKDTKKIAHKFLKSHKLQTVDYKSLKAVVQNMGYTIIEFNSIANDQHVCTVIQNLNLCNEILKSRGFTYTSQDFRLVFINEGLSDQEKLLVLSHETGHIVCNHFSSAPIIGKDVSEEYEANEFVHYLLKPPRFKKTSGFISLHRKSLIVTAIALLVIFTALFAYIRTKNAALYMDGYYITSTGNCYHKEKCIFVKNKSNVNKLTKEDFEKRTYAPCNICLPGKN